MRNVIIALPLAAMAALAGACFSGEPGIDPQPVVEAEREPSNWEKFKQGAKQAGSAAVAGAHNAAGKTADAVVHGAKATGEFFSDGYQDAREYIHEKTE